MMTSSAAIADRASSKVARIFSRDHRTIGRQYFWLAIVAVAVGMFLSLLMRLHMVWPAAQWPLFGAIKPENYLAFMTMHGTLMIFFVLSTAPQNAFGNLLLPAMIGARRMAFPTMNMLAFWGTLLAFVVMLAAMLVAGGAPTAGWTQYPPLSAIPAAAPGMDLGMDLWLLSIAIFCVSSVLASVNKLVTVFRMRADGMHFLRMPLPVWSWFVTAMLTLLAFSVLFAAALMLFLDRRHGTSFFVPGGLVINGQLVPRSGGSPLLWQHLFWFFGHPEVYITILPGMGVVSHLLSTFARRPIFGYTAMVHSTLAIGVLGFLVWGHHMFTSGLSPFSTFIFSSLTLAIAVPSAVKVINWLATLWRGRIQLTTPMLFAIGFVSLFITGGLSGPILAQPALNTYLHDTYFVVAHFHMVMGMAAVFALFAATYFWFPKLFSGRMASEPLGKWHFWLTFLAAYSTFMPMHFLGLAGHPRRYAQIAGSADYLQPLLPLQVWVTASAMVLIGAQLIFFYNLFHSMRLKQTADANPWSATTLEWCELASPIVHRGPYDFHSSSDGDDFTMQHEPVALK